MSRWNPMCDKCVLNSSGCLRQEADKAEDREDGPIEENDFDKDVEVDG